ncbi:VOC family protein [Mesorhizobium sp. M3A.F.Ca.ET.201.01.1.1]|uniref:VOC family protein n=1 Tax=Mesorhizobium sp. M3A.F.Ca.ET.201.01.1.1 TaxID=2563946 RepID=UPI001093EDF0|nr:VOC family protein [Mesorhizobium sp. M3A.F.Ca.ET.201.01.1.1]TGS71711.1 VOC family protein [Mesorhizobium sp. M3A.F.Ca.ET.201.01.1.1]
MRAARGVDHIGITVPDLDQAQAYIEAVFAGEKLYDLLVDPVSGPELAVDLAVPAGTTLEAIRVMALGNGPGLEMFKYSVEGQRKPVRACDLGTQHFAVFVEDIEEAAALVTAHGGRVHGLIKDLPLLEAGKNNRYVYTSPPWGGIIELVQISSPQSYEAITDRRRWQPARRP